MSESLKEIQEAFKNYPGEHDQSLLNKSREIKVSGVVMPPVLPEGPIAPAIDQLVVATHIFEKNAFADVLSQYDGGKPIRTTLKDGDFLICPPGVSLQHSWCAYNTSSVRNMGMHISPLHVARVSLELFDQDPRLLEFPAGLGWKNSLLSEMILRLGDEIKRGNPSGVVYLDQLSDSIVAELVRSCPTRRPKQPVVKGGLAPYVFKRVCDYIQEYYWDKERVRIPLLAKEAGLSESHFIRMFKVSAGCSPSQFVADCRVKMALELIEKGDMPLTQVAFNVGYESYAGFHKQFVKNMGRSPQQFKIYM